MSNRKQILVGRLPRSPNISICTWIDYPGSVGKRLPPQELQPQSSGNVPSSTGQPCVTAEVQSSELISQTSAVLNTELMLISSTNIDSEGEKKTINWYDALQANNLA